MFFSKRSSAFGGKITYSKDQIHITSDDLGLAKNPNGTPILGGLKCDLRRIWDLLVVSNSDEMVC